jgi:hypothetical protein
MTTGDRSRCIWVSLPHATFGLVVAGGRVIEAPPIAQRAVKRLGRDEHRVAAYYRARGAQFRSVPETSEAAV